MTHRTCIDINRCEKRLQLNRVAPASFGSANVFGSATVFGLVQPRGGREVGEEGEEMVERREIGEIVGLRFGPVVGARPLNMCRIRLARCLDQRCLQ